ncbi:hypothetical protein RJ640_018852 [Escallonia rubra]|uniref:Stress-response A/B barrel domain-containing protein n=1 Tax=Escallonia rubra TaxID=112253 RepID=A0AA88RQ54_9ASTE|nr:hypothetical protein RJ640_018852 [Escallonia rubra]
MWRIRCLAGTWTRRYFPQLGGNGILAFEVGILESSADMVVEHICLLKAKADLSDEEENDMLDYLYTSQYQMAGILAISLGRISSQNTGNYTHAIFIRFQRKEDVAKFYENPFYLGVVKDHGIINVDYESEVEDDILSLFRKGEEFNYGVEFVLLIAFAESSTGDSVQDALTSLVNLTMQFPSLIVQGTQGLCTVNTTPLWFSVRYNIKFP